MIGEEDEDEKEPVVEGPQLPDVIDRVTAEPLPAGASNGKLGDADTAWPPPVPAEAPGMVAAAPPVTGAMAQQPQAPGAAPPVNVPQDTAQGYADQQQLAGDDAAALQKIGTAKAAAGTAEADQLDTEADRRQDAADQQAAIMQTANQRTQQWADRAAQENEKYMKMDLHDYWADKSTGSKVLGGLAMILGAVGRTDNSGNAGMQIINSAIERDFRMQQARIEKQKGNAAAAKEQYQTGLTEKEQALSDAKLKEAAATDAAAAKLVALKVRQGIPVEQAQNDADVIALKQKANTLRIGTLKDVHSMNLEDAKLEIEKQKEADERLRAEAYARKMAAKGAGGGGGSLAPIAQFIKDHPNDQPGAYAMAEKMGYKGPKAAALVDKLQNDYKTGGGANQVPSVLTDTLTGKDLPVDASRTDAKKHNAAVAGLPQVNGAIQILDKVLGQADKPAAPEALSYLGMDTSKQAGLTGEMTRFRSAYAASKKESVGEANAKELAQAIPDPPSALAPKAAWNNWKAKIEATREELHESRNGLLANAGIAPKDMGGVNDRPGKAPVGEAPPAAAPKAVPGGKAGAAARILQDPAAPKAKKDAAKAYLLSIGQ